MSEDTETIKDILDKLAQKSFLTAHSPGYTKLDGRTYSKHTEEALKSIEKITQGQQSAAERKGYDHGYSEGYAKGKKDGRNSSQMSAEFNHYNQTGMV